MKKSLAICFVLITPFSFSSAHAAELQRHTVMSDGHPLALWEKSSVGAAESILLVHGRTWSARPDYDLQVPGEELSLMDGLVAEGYAVFAIDLRGYGATPRDETEWLTPNRAADDVAVALSWIAAQRDWRIKPHLFGWSMGSTVVQLSVQRHPDRVSSLTLFGYWRDVDVDIPDDDPNRKPAYQINTAQAAASDFIIPGSISAAAVDRYVTMALLADPIRTDVRGREQYNALDESQIVVPTLVIAGAQDPIAPDAIQQKLVRALGATKKRYVSIPGGDHAAFLESPRALFIEELVGFLRWASE